MTQPPAPDDPAFEGDAVPDDTGIRESNPNAGGPQGAAGGMGVSSERIGHTGPRQESTDGVKPVHPLEVDRDAPPEQRPGAVEDNPVGVTPRQAPDPDDVGR